MPLKCDYFVRKCRCSVTIEETNWKRYIKLLAYPYRHWKRYIKLLANPYRHWKWYTKLLANPYRYWKWYTNLLANSYRHWKWYTKLLANPYRHWKWYTKLLANPYRHWKWYWNLVANPFRNMIAHPLQSPPGFCIPDTGHISCLWCVYTSHGCRCTCVSCCCQPHCVRMQDISYTGEDLGVPYMYWLGTLK